MTRPRTTLRWKAGCRVAARASRFLLQVRRSPIHGLGVFGREPIPARQRVIEYVGERITAEEAWKRWEPARAPGKPAPVYLFRVSRKRSIDGSVGGNGAELINHSCAPNLDVRRIRGRVSFFSRRAIRAGEELTLDYRFPRDGEKVICRCGSPKCRGTINRK